MPQPISRARTPGPNRAPEAITSARRIARNRPAGVFQPQTNSGSRRASLSPWTISRSALKMVMFANPYCLVRLVSDKFDSPGCKDNHSQQQPTVFPALDVGGAVGALAITNGQINYFVVQLGGAEEEVKITERIKIPKI